MPHVDILKIAKRVEAGGLTREQADAIASSLHDVDTSDLATKTDLTELESDLRTELAQMETRLTGQIYIGQAATIGIPFTLLRLFP